MHKSQFDKEWSYLISIIISLTAGILSLYIIRRNHTLLDTLSLPPASMSFWLFRVIWTILLILLGYSAALIYITYTYRRENALALYAAQLMFLCLWSVFFFHLKLYFFSLIIGLFLIFLTLCSGISFYKIQKKAGLVQLIYLLWLCYCCFLNFDIMLHN